MGQGVRRTPSSALSSVAGLEIKNRVIMPAMHMAWPTEGYRHPRAHRLLRGAGQGGPGAGAHHHRRVLHREARYGRHPFVSLEDDRFIPGLREFTTLMHRHDTPCAAQLYHAGRYAISFIIGEQPVGPSAVPSRFTRETPRELSTRTRYRRSQREYRPRAPRTRPRRRFRRGGAHLLLRVTW